MTYLKKIIGVALIVGLSMPLFAYVKIGLVLEVNNPINFGQNKALRTALVKVFNEWEQVNTDINQSIYRGEQLELHIREAHGSQYDWERLLHTLGSDNFDILLSIGPAYVDTIARVAPQYPETHFVILDAKLNGITEEENITCINFNTHEIAFLLGAIAASINIDEQLGFIGIYDTASTIKLWVGFAAGAVFTDPTLIEDEKIQRILLGHAPNVDIRLAEVRARIMYERGVRTIFIPSGIVGYIITKVASQAGLYVVGAKSDLRAELLEEKESGYSQYANSILASYKIHYDIIIKQLIIKYIEHDNSMDGGYINYGMDDGVLDVITYDPALFPDVENQIMTQSDIDSMRELIINQSIKIPIDEEELRQWLGNYE